MASNMLEHMVDIEKEEFKNKQTTNDNYKPCKEIEVPEWL